MLKTPLLLLTALAASAAYGDRESAPDSWGPFQDRREVSASGRRYAVVRKGPKATVSYELCRRRPGAEPMQKAIAEPPRRRGAATAKVDVSRDPADVLVLKATADQLPLRVLVADTIDGLLLFDQYARVGHGKTIRWIDGNSGEVTAERTLVQLFGAVPAGARLSVSSIWWNEHVSLDEQRRSIVVVDCDLQVREVAMDGGAVSTPEWRQELAWCQSGDEDRRATMLEVVANWPRDAARRAEPILLGIFHHRGEAMRLRLRAAVALHRLELPIDADELFAEARARGNPRAVRDYAVSHLSVVCGERAIPVLREFLATDGTTTWHEGLVALQRLGDAGARALIEMMFEQDKSPHFRRGAANALGSMHASGDQAIEALLRAAAQDEEGLANSALNALVMIAPPDLTERLLPLLESGCGDDARLVLYFRSNPTRRALPGLKQARLRLLGGDAHELKWADEAIERSERAIERSERER